MNINLGHTSHSGIKRDHNEDTYGIDLEAGLFLVADGMGGHDHGEIASALARDHILHAIKDGVSIKQAILDANQEIINSSIELVMATLDEPSRRPEARLYACEIVERGTLRPLPKQQRAQSD